MLYCYIYIYILVTNIVYFVIHYSRRGIDDESLTNVSPVKSTAKKRTATKRRKYDESEDSDISTDDSDEVVTKSPNKKKPTKPKKRSVCNELQYILLYIYTDIAYLMYMYIEICLKSK